MKEELIVRGGVVKSMLTANNKSKLPKQTCQHNFTEFLETSLKKHVKQICMNSVWKCLFGGINRGSAIICCDICNSNLSKIQSSSNFYYHLNSRKHRKASSAKQVCGLNTVVMEACLKCGILCIRAISRDPAEETNTQSHESKVDKLNHSDSGLNDLILAVPSTSQGTGIKRKHENNFIASKENSLDCIEIIEDPKPKATKLLGSHEVIIVDEGNSEATELLSVNSREIISVNEENSESDHDVSILDEVPKVITIDTDSDDDSIQIIPKESDIVLNVSDDEFVVLDNDAHSCFSHAYLLYKNADLKSFWSDVVNITFMPKNKIGMDLNKVQFFCDLCHSNAIVGLASLMSHIGGAKHRKAEQNSTSGKSLTHRLILCRMCGNITYCCSDNPDAQVEVPLVGSIKSVIDGIQSTEDLFLNSDVGKGTRKINYPHQDSSFFFSINELKAGTKFLDVFKALRIFCEDNNMSICYVFSNTKLRKAVGCLRKRKFSHISRPVCYICNKRYGLLEISKHQAILNTKTKFEDGCSIWLDGDMSPDCDEILSNPDYLMSIVSELLDEMATLYTSYDTLSSSILRDLHRVLKGLKVRSIDFFGSRVTGLAMNESDFDVALCAEGWNGRSRTLTVNDIRNIVLSKGRQFFSVDSVIPRAKVPIIKLSHLQTNSKCDLSINNLGGVFNSQMVRFYLDLDYRVKWLIAFVKVWSSMNNLRGSSRITSYAFAWLVLFFLMQKENPLVPTVHFLATMPSEIRLRPQFTNFSYSMDHDLVRGSHYFGPAEYLEPLELLKRFFIFYSTADLENNIVYPLTGQFIDRNLLRNRPPPPEGAPRNINANRLDMTPMIVLDPIHTFVNITPAADRLTVKLFKKLCKVSSQKMCKYV